MVECVEVEEVEGRPIAGELPRSRRTDFFFLFLFWGGGGWFESNAGKEVK